MWSIPDTVQNLREINQNVNENSHEKKIILLKQTTIYEFKLLSSVDKIYVNLYIQRIVVVCHSTI